MASQTTQRISVDLEALFHVNPLKRTYSHQTSSLINELRDVITKGLDGQLFETYVEHKPVALSVPLSLLKQILDQNVLNCISLLDKDKVRFTFPHSRIAIFILPFYQRALVYFPFEI